MIERGARPGVRHVYQPPLHLRAPSPAVAGPPLIRINLLHYGALEYFSCSCAHCDANTKHACVRRLRVHLPRVRRRPVRRL